MSSRDDRRSIQRINLESPLGAKLASGKVTLLDVSATGARIEHGFALAKGRMISLEFEFEGQVVHMRCEVTRCSLEKGQGHAHYRSGLRFDTTDPGLVLIKDIIARLVTRDFEARKAHLKLVEA